MQVQNDKILYLKNKLGKVFKSLRERQNNISINQLALEWDLDKGSLSKLERGIYDCRISTALKICEAVNIKFSDFAKILEYELGEDFKFMNE